MPAYSNSAFAPAKLLQKGVPAYLFGTFDYGRGNTNLYITNVALTTNVATITVQVLNGPAPRVGDILSIIGSASTAGLFNVNSATITATTINNTTGAGTLTFALTHADVGTAADSGTVIVEPMPIGETVAAIKSLAVCVQAPEGDSQFTLPASITFSTLPTAITVTLQVAIMDIDSEYTNTTTVWTVSGTAFTAGPVVQITLQRGYFYRFIGSGLTLGSGAGMVGKIG